MSFKDKVVLITGSSSGIGAETAVNFSEEGARVVLVGRNESKLNAVAARCRDPLVLVAELSNDSDVKQIIDQTIEKFGKLDVLVNNAGIVSHGKIGNENFMESCYDLVMKVNFRAVVLLTNLAVPYLIQTKGNIVNVSSVAGLSAADHGLSVYSASKAALNNFTACTAAELAKYGVRVNVVSPGATKTSIETISGDPLLWDKLQEMSALKRMSEPKEISDVILYFASDKAVGVTGSNFVVDNGYLIGKFA